MAAYKDLVGQKITKVFSNPHLKTGQMWYNSTDGKLKGLGTLGMVKLRLMIMQETYFSRIKHSLGLFLEMVSEN